LASAARSALARYRSEGDGVVVDMPQAYWWGD
jgi:hypothetical protein